MDHSATETRPIKFGGYLQPKDRPIEEITAHVGPGTPCGEYMRRFWHPVLLSSQLGKRPRVIRVLGEDLVIYRDLSGDIGLLHKHCAHRGASLEFGVIAEHGIRCCYHGWMYGNDGALLETPGEPPTSPHKTHICQGAYPVVEFKDVIFAYLGPPEARPEFPVFDAMVMPDNRMVPYIIYSPCNWQQVSENSMDPFHVPFLHTRIAGPQFSEIFAELPIIAYHETQYGFFYTNARRVGDYIWVRMHDHMVPNFSQNGAIFENVGRVRYFGRPGLTRWVLPMDDTNTAVIAWRHFNDRDDPDQLGQPDNVGIGKTDFYGQSGDRPYEERQDNPGDYEAWCGLGSITSHAREHLATTDRGIALLRRRLKREIENLQKGVEPLRPTPTGGTPIPTFGGDTILRIPSKGNDDAQLISDVCAMIAGAYTETQGLPDDDRRAAIAARLAPMNQGSTEEINPNRGKIFEFKTLG